MTQFPDDTDYVQYVVVCAVNVNMLTIIYPDNPEEILGMSWSSLDLSNVSQLNFLTGKFKKWLDPPDPSINHNNARNKYFENTGQWLLDDEKYLTWKQQPNSLMWINGICECHIYSTIMTIAECV